GARSGPTASSSAVDPAAAAAGEWTAARGAAAPWPSRTGLTVPTAAEGPAAAKVVTVAPRRAVRYPRTSPDASPPERRRPPPARRARRRRRPAGWAAGPRPASVAGAAARR